MKRFIPATCLVVLVGGLMLLSFPGAYADEPARRPVKPMGLVSAPDENEDDEPDDVFRPPEFGFRMRRDAGAKSGPTGATGSAATSGAGVTGPLSQHPKRDEIARKVAQAFSAREIDVILLAGHKYMINDCLGIKVSAGGFRLKFINPTVRVDGTGLVFETGINRIELSAIKLRMRPRVPTWDKPNPCKFSKKFEVGGEVEDLRFTVRFDPVLDIERCRIMDVGSPQSQVRIGNLNLKPLQNNLDALAKNMVEDAVTYFLNIHLHSQILQTIDDVLEADCPGAPAGTARAAREGLSRLGGGPKGGGSPAAPAGSGPAAGAPAGKSGGTPAPRTDAPPPAPSDTGAGTPGAAPAAPSPVGGTGGAAGPGPEVGGGGPGPSAPADPAMAQRMAELEARIAALESAASTPSPGESSGAATVPKSGAAALPARTAPAGTAARGMSGAFEVSPNAELKGRLGRLVVAFPAAEVSGTRVAVLRGEGDEEVAVKYGNSQIELMPGTYVVDINGKRVSAVTIQSRHATTMTVGVLRVHGSSDTRFEVFERGGLKGLQVKYGNNDIGLPVGDYEVVVRDTREPVRIEAGVVTEF